MKEVQLEGFNCINVTNKSQHQAQNDTVSFEKIIEPKKLVQAQPKTSQQNSSTVTTDEDKIRAGKEKRRGKRIATECTKLRIGPELYNSFQALGCLGEEG